MGTPPLFNGRLLIYMSIHESLQRAVCDRHLHYLPMTDRSDPVRRRMFIHEEVRAALLDGTTEVQRVRMMQLRADLERFVKGSALLMCFAPKKGKDDAHFALLNPPGEACWDVRSLTPSPSLRVLGMFADVDAFVALDWWPKRIKVAWSGKEPLGDDDLLWRLAIHECRARWHSILPGEIPVAGRDVRRYVTGYVDVRQ